MGDGRGREHTPDERRVLFAKGFGDGAKASAVRHGWSLDYMEGWAAGRKARKVAVKAYRAEHSLPTGSPLRQAWLGAK